MPRTVLVTGAARGQGRAHAVRFGGLGDRLVLVDSCAPSGAADYPMPTPEDLQETARLVEQAGGEASAHVVDVRDHVALDAAVDEAVDRFGPVGVVVANAGVSPRPTGLLDCRVEDWQEVLDVNLSGVFFTMRAGLRSMVAADRGGAVVLVSSMMGLRALGGIPAYVASKHGVTGLMRTAAYELGPRGIRVNSVHPGNVRTPMVVNDDLKSLFRPDVPPAEVDEAVLETAMRPMNLLPSGWAEADDVTDAVVFLCSDAARSITGVTLPVDLGATLK